MYFDDILSQYLSGYRIVMDAKMFCYILSVYVRKF